MLTVELAGDPKGKGRPRFDPRSLRAYSPAPTVKYEAALRKAASEAMAGRPLFSGPLAVTILATLRVPASWPQAKRAAAVAGRLWPTSRPDVDNIQKIALDALNKVVWPDDAAVVECHARKRYGARPGLVIVVKEQGP